MPGRFSSLLRTKNDCGGCRANVVFPLVELFEKISSFFVKNGPILLYS